MKLIDAKRNQNYFSHHPMLTLVTWEVCHLLGMGITCILGSKALSQWPWSNHTPRILGKILAYTDVYCVGLVSCCICLPSQHKTQIGTDQSQYKMWCTIFFKLLPTTEICLRLHITLLVTVVWPVFLVRALLIWILGNRITNMRIVASCLADCLSSEQLIVVWLSWEIHLMGGLTRLADVWLRSNLAMIA